MLINKKFLLSDIKDEFRFWSQLIAPELNLPKNVSDICHYGFTEILNNIIDHSEGNSVLISCEQNHCKTAFELIDDGAGVFTKLRKHFDFDSNVHALIELTKGKLTVAPEAHSGEGIFFSSKMFDRFVIEADELSVVFENDRCDVHIIPHRHGSRFKMEIANDSRRVSQDVFNQFTDADDFMFCKTKFFVSLAALEGELMSRSQAKRIVARFENFKDVELDFSDVNSIGQGFADEIVRVWPLANPGTQIKIMNPVGNVLKMLKHVMNRTDIPQPSTLVEIDSVERLFKIR